MIKVSAIVLAAGLSRRMGAVNKLELEIGGVPLLKHILDTLLQSNLHQLQVVVGHQSDQIKQILQGLDVNIVENPHFEEGQMTSVHAGLQATPEHVDGVMICLSDQPLLTVTDINYLISYYETTERDRILIPTFEGKRGNPIIIPSNQAQGIISGDRNLGCKRLIQRHPELTAVCPMNNDHVVVDIDTDTDYQFLRNRIVSLNQLNKNQQIQGA